jgi:hypothetical protein
MLREFTRVDGAIVTCFSASWEEKLLYTLLAVGISLGWGQLAVPVEEPIVTILWVTGDARVVNEDGIQEAAVGTRLGRRTALEVDADASVILHQPGQFLFVVTGHTQVETARLMKSPVEDISGVERLILPSVFPTQREQKAWALLPTGTPQGRFISLASPRETVISDPRPSIRWTVSSVGRRVHFSLEKLTSQGTLVPVERWVGLVGDVHRPVDELQLGSSYRVTVGVGHQFSSAFFHVVGAEDKRRFEHNQKVFREFFKSARLESPVPRILEAQWLESYGRYAAAYPIWFELEQNHPYIRHFSTRVKRLQTRRLEQDHMDTAVWGAASWVQSILSSAVGLL